MRACRGLLGPGVLSVLLLAACHSGPKVIGGKCGGTTCAANQACVGGQCETLPSCTTDADCTSGGHCAHGFCQVCDPNVQCVAGYDHCDPSYGSCVGCTSNSDCPSERPVCDGFSICAQCAVDADCPGTDVCSFGQCKIDCMASPSQCPTSCNYDKDCPPSAPVCGDYMCGHCRSAADCGANQACRDAECAPAPPGDVCQNAIPVDLTAGPVHMDVGLDGYGLDWAATDSPVGAEDVFFKVHVPADGILTVAVKVDALFEASSTVLAGPCDDLAEVPPLDPMAQPAQYPVGAGDVFVWVASTEVSTHIDLSFVPKAQAPGTTCFHPIPVTLDANLAATISVPDPVGTGTATGACGSEQMAYVVDLPVRAGLHVTGTGANGGGPYVSVFPANCFGDAAHGQCLGTPGGGPLSATYDTPLPAGETYLLVGEGGYGAGPYVVNLAFSPWPANDHCAQAIPLTFTGSTARASGDLTFLEPSGCSCVGDPSVKGLYYTFSTVGLGPHSVTATLDAPAGGPELSVETACGVCQGQAGQVLACDAQRYASRTSASVMLPDLPEGQYVLHVMGNPGPASLQLDLGPDYPPSPNSDCTSPAAVDLASGAATVQGDTRGAANSEKQCAYSNTNWDGRDVVYALSTPGAGRIGASVTPTSAGFDPAIGLLSRCDGTGPAPAVCSNAAGADATESASAVVTSSPVYLWVDSRTAPGGSFTASLIFTPAPPNDTCAAPVTLTAGVPVTGDLTGATNTTGVCVFGTIDDPDEWFQFTAGKGSSTTVTLTPTGFDGYLAVMTGCGGYANCSGTVDAAGSGQPETLTIATSRGQTYLVRVGGHGGAYGAFTITVN